MHDNSLSVWSMQPHGSCITARVEVQSKLWLHYSLSAQPFAPPSCVHWLDEEEEEGEVRERFLFLSTCINNACVSTGLCLCTLWFLALLPFQLPPSSISFFLQARQKVTAISQASQVCQVFDTKSIEHKNHHHHHHKLMVSNSNQLIFVAFLLSKSNVCKLHNSKHIMMIDLACLVHINRNFFILKEVLTSTSSKMSSI